MSLYSTADRAVLAMAGDSAVCEDQPGCKSNVWHRIDLLLLTLRRGQAPALVLPAHW